MKTKGLKAVKTKYFLAITGVVLAPVLGVMAQPSPGPDAKLGAQAEAPVNVSPAVAEIVNLAESGTSEQQILTKIQSSPGSYNLGADDVIYLKDVGLSSAVINAMLSHGSAGASATVATASRPPSVQPEEPRGQPQQPPLVTAPYVPQERQYANDSPPPPVTQATPSVEVSSFYTDLAPYGTWVQLDGVGMCWQPRAVVVNRSWQPYCDSGHWVWTDAGWFWQSDYSWGWAPFHYGRWQLHERCGWVWLPDTTWGPSWVVWRTGGDYCGWAPCPPGAVFDVGFGGWRYRGAHVSASFDFGLGFNHFTFINYSDFGHRDYGRVRISNRENTRIYNNTTVINNYTVVNNRVVNRGLPVDRVSKASHTEFRQVAIRDVRGGATATERSGGGSSRGQAVYRHELKTPERLGPVAVQKVDSQHSIVHQTQVVSTRERSAAASSSGRERNSQSYDSRSTTRSTVDRSTPAARGERQPVDRNSSTPSTSRTDERRDAPRSAPLTPSRSSDPRRDTSTSVDSSRSVDTRSSARTAPLTPDRSVSERRDSSSRAIESRSRSESAGSYQPKTYQEPRSAPRERPRIPNPGATIGD
jgi:hypothetical protein